MRIFFFNGDPAIAGLYFQVSLFSNNKKLFYICSRCDRFNIFHNHSLAIHKIQKTKLIMLGFFNARDVGIEPTSFLLERKMLPLHQSRIINIFYKSINNNKNFLKYFAVAIPKSNTALITNLFINTSMWFIIYGKLFFFNTSNARPKIYHY